MAAAARCSSKASRASARPHWCAPRLLACRQAAARSSGAPATNWARNCRCCRSSTRSRSAAPSVNARRATIAGLLRAEVRHRSRHRRPGDDRRAAHRADHRRDRGATRGARHRRPSVGRPGHRAAVGTPRKDRAPGAAAADRPDQARRAPGGPARAAPRGRRDRPGPARRAAGAGRPRNSSARWPAGGRMPRCCELAAGAAGNPLYLTELLAALSRSGGITVTAGGAAQLATGCVPDSLPAAIAHRLGFVSGPTKEVLRAAALLGVEFAVPDLTAVLGRSVADLVPALEEARATGVLTDVARRPRLPPSADQGGPVRGPARRRARRVAPRRGTRPRDGGSASGPGGQAVASRDQRQGRRRERTRSAGRPGCGHRQRQRPAR